MRAPSSELPTPFYMSFLYSVLQTLLVFLRKRNTEKLCPPNWRVRWEYTGSHSLSEQKLSRGTWESGIRPETGKPE